MSFDYVMETACAQTITILYKYFCIWRLDLRYNNINLYSLLSIFIIIVIIIELLNHYSTSESVPKVQISQISE